MFYILAQLTTFYKVEKSVKTRSDFCTFPFRVCFSPISAKFCIFPELFFSADFRTIYHSVEMWGNYAGMYGNIILILLGNSAEFRRKDFRTVLRNSTEISCPG